MIWKAQRNGCDSLGWEEDDDEGVRPSGDKTNRLGMEEGAEISE